MIIELFITLQIMVIAFFLTAYVTRAEIIWALSIVTSALASILSFHLTLPPDTIVYTKIIFLIINTVLFILSVFYIWIDTFDKYGSKLYNMIRRRK